MFIFSLLLFLRVGLTPQCQMMTHDKGKQSFGDDSVTSAMSGNSHAAPLQTLVDSTRVLALANVRPNRIALVSTKDVAASKQKSGFPHPNPDSLTHE